MPVDLKCPETDMNQIYVGSPSQTDQKSLTGTILILLKYKKNTETYCRCHRVRKIAKLILKCKAVHNELDSQNHLN